MGFHDLDEAFAWIESFTNLERSGSLFSSRTYQLDRMRFLAGACGRPQNACRTVHLAGTKGKGSTAVLIAESLARAGLRTGLYTSPHVVGYQERIRVLPGRSEAAPDGPAQELLLAQAEELRELVDDLAEELREVHGPPSTFELLTLLAFCSFRAAGCDIAVVETGIGGRLDATNLVLPELAIITPIELEHTDVLGDTLEAIAGEKAGIIKRGVPVISATQSPEAEAVLRAAARERGCPITFLEEELNITAVSCTPEGTRLRLAWRRDREPDREEPDQGRQEPEEPDWERPDQGGQQRPAQERLAQERLAQERPALELRLALLGTHQAENAALAFLALRRLAIPLEAVKAGFAAARLPARMELLQRFPPVVLDGAHTPRSVARVLESFRSLFGERGVLLFAAAAGKRFKEMAAILAPAFGAVVVTSTGSFRESVPEEVHRAFAALNPSAELVTAPAAALVRAREHSAGELPLLITGSFYLAGEVRRAWSAGSGPATAAGA